jgi:predicted DNA-binding transcriptional regulator AlpA
MLQTSETSGSATNAATRDDDDTLLTSNQTRARVGNVSHMCIWRWRRDERVQFPQPIQINRRNYWRLGDLRRWQATRTQKAA